MLNKYERAAKKFEDAGAIIPVGSITPVTPQSFAKISTDVSTVAALRNSVNVLIDALTAAGVLTTAEQSGPDSDFVM